VKAEAEGKGKQETFGCRPGFFAADARYTTDDFVRNIFQCSAYGDLLSRIGALRPVASKNAFMPVSIDVGQEWACASLPASFWHHPSGTFVERNKLAPLSQRFSSYA
jgi:hypothetical protein